MGLPLPLLPRGAYLLAPTEAARLPRLIGSLVDDAGFLRLLALIVTAAR